MRTKVLFVGSAAALGLTLGGNALASAAYRNPLCSTTVGNETAAVGYHAEASASDPYAFVAVCTHPAPFGETEGHGVSVGSGYGVTSVGVTSWYTQDWGGSSYGTTVVQVAPGGFCQNGPAKVGTVYSNAGLFQPTRLCV